MTAKEFFDRFNNQAIDYDGAYGNQCMDLAEEYNRDVIGAPRLTGNAADVWDNYPKDFYDQIPNTPTGIPQLGDIIIWNRRVGGGFGHIAIFSTGDANKFTSFDQNWPEGSVCHFQDHANYANIFGWLHPKAITTVAVDPIVFQNLVRKSTIYDEVQKKLNVTDSETIVLGEVDKLLSYEDVLRQKDSQIQSNVAQITTLKTQIEKLKQDHDTLSAQNQALVVKTDEQQTSVENLSKEAQDRQKTIDSQGDTITTLQASLKTLQTATGSPSFTGWRKFIYDILRR